MGASFWLSLLGAGFIPAIYLIAYILKPDGASRQLGEAPWNVHFFMGWQGVGFFLLPMFVVLLCALVTQIEFKNNTWKQVYASPQSYGQIYFSKLLIIHTMIIFFFIAFNLFMLGTGIVSALVHKQLAFLKSSFDVQKLVELNAKMYISTMGIAAIQYWLSLRFKNFIVPMGIGLALLIAAIVATNLGWEHIYKVPFAQPGLTLRYVSQPVKGWLQPHEWNSIIAFVIFTIGGFLDVIYKKEKG